MPLFQSPFAFSRPSCLEREWYRKQGQLQPQETVTPRTLTLLTALLVNNNEHFHVDVDLSPLWDELTSTVTIHNMVGNLHRINRQSKAIYSAVSLSDSRPSHIKRSSK
jgi:hypothetical protein